ncbi:MAG: L,D-transpeptidase [Odoribacter sp.]
MMRGKRDRGVKKHIRWIWWLLLLPLLIGGILTVLVCMANEPPVQELEAARIVLSNAEKLNAEIYCNSLYREAKAMYDTAMKKWKQQNEKIIFLRNFDEVETLAVKAESKGKEAIQKAKSVQQDTRKELRDEIALLRSEMSDFEKIFIALPLGRKIINQHSSGKLLLNEAEIAFEKGEFNVGQQKIRIAAESIRRAYQSGRKMLDEYFKNLPTWQKQLKKAIEQSDREKSYLIVVEKVPAYCMIYYNGKKKYSFPVEFGKNWLGEKRCEGDYATPEGEYRVIKRLDGSRTRYYKALLLDYPNAVDRANFQKLKKDGVILRNAQPGGLIELHGGGGRGGNWTNGCVALENEDMATLYRYTSKGTKVLIIGASEELNEKRGE